MKEFVTDLEYHITIFSHFFDISIPEAFSDLDKRIGAPPLQTLVDARKHSLDIASSMATLFRGLPLRFALWACIASAESAELSEDGRTMVAAIGIQRFRVYRIVDGLLSASKERDFTLAEVGDLYGCFFATHCAHWLANPTRKSAINEHHFENLRLVTERYGETIEGLGRPVEGVPGSRWLLNAYSMRATMRLAFGQW